MSQVTITLLFLLFAIVMFMWEKIPLGLTSMIVCVGLVVTGVSSYTDPEAPEYRLPWSGNNCCTGILH